MCTYSLHLERASVEDATKIVHAKSYTPRKGALLEQFDPRSIKVLWSNVLVLREEEEERTEGGIYKPDTARGPKFTGIVISKGPDCTCEAIKADTRVMFSKYAGAELEIEGATYALMSETDVLAIVPNEVRADRVD